MRIVIFAGVAAFALLTPLYVFIPMALLYALWRPAYELIILGAVIDAQFGLGIASFGYLYTLVLGAIVLGAEFLKPHLSFYNT